MVKREISIIFYSKYRLSIHEQITFKSLYLTCNTGLTYNYFHHMHQHTYCINPLLSFVVLTRSPNSSYSSYTQV